MLAYLEQFGKQYIITPIHKLYPKYAKKCTKNSPKNNCPLKLPTKLPKKSLTESPKKSPKNRQKNRPQKILLLFWIICIIIHISRTEARIFSRCE